jgi:hypothetical protein
VPSAAEVPIVRRGYGRYDDEWDDDDARAEEGLPAAVGTRGRRDARDDDDDEDDDDDDHARVDWRR